jgi:hypothetical protein
LSVTRNPYSLLIKHFAVRVSRCHIKLGFVSQPRPVETGANPGPQSRHRHQVATDVIFRNLTRSSKDEWTGHLSLCLSGGVWRTCLVDSQSGSWAKLGIAAQRGMRCPQETPTFTPGRGEGFFFSILGHRSFYWNSNAVSHARGRFCPGQASLARCNI